MKNTTTRSNTTILRKASTTSEPNTPAIWLFTIGSIVGLILVIVAVQGYFEEIYKEAVYDRVLSVPSELLQDVRNRDAWNLTHYMYGDLDKSTNRVRMPIDKAMQIFAHGSRRRKAVLSGQGHGDQDRATGCSRGSRWRGSGRRHSRWRSSGCGSAAKSAAPAKK